MSFNEHQARLLSGKLQARHVKTRTSRDGFELAYIEGWHAIAEANRIFGFEGWDRETVSAHCVWHDPAGRATTAGQYACAYCAQVRITVRAGETSVVREGSGVGHGQAPTPGEAHESALKEAETDAMKRALVTFGNLFGLALYDKERRGVRAMSEVSPSRARTGRRLKSGWAVHGRFGRSLKEPRAYCSEIRAALEGAESAAELEAVWATHVRRLEHMRALTPALTNKNGVHFVTLLQNLYNRHRAMFDPPKAAETAPKRAGAREPVTVLLPAVSRGVLAFPKPIRVRNRAHLRFVAAQPCLVCDRRPVQAHHLRDAQPRALALKASDEYAVPLCRLHHRALHDVGDESAFWKEHGIDPRVRAEHLWAQSRGAASDDVPSKASGAE